MSTFPEDFATISTGARLHYVDTGTPVDAPEALPIIVLHGLVGTAETQLGNVIDWLRPRYRVIGPTLRGYGQSTPKPRTFTPNFYHVDADDAVALLDALNIPQAHLMGYSDGGEAALIAAGKYPDRFKSVVVWGAVGYYGPAMRSAAQNTFPGTWITEEEKRLHNIDAPDHFTLQWVQSVRFIIDSGGDLSVSLLAHCTAPLLFLLGENDRLNPAEYAQKAADSAQTGKVAMFPCGHAVHTEAEAQFRKVVGAFLTSTEEA